MRRDMLIFSVTFQTPTETKKVKRRQKIQRCSEPFRCSRMFTRIQGHECFRRVQSNEYCDPENGCSCQNCQPRETFVAPKPDVRPRLQPKNGEKQDQHGILKRRGTQQESSNSRFAERRRVFISCMPRILARSLTFQEETRRCHSCFLHMISGTSSESDSSCNRVSNATGSVD